MASQSHVRLFVLKYGAIEDATIYRLEKGWSLHFSLNASLAGLNVRLFVNHPLDPTKGPNRTSYRELDWINEATMKVDNFDSYAETPIVMAGSFNYFFTIDGSDKQSNLNGSGYFLVDPVLKVGKMNDRLPLDAICCQSVLPKLLGKLPDWVQSLQVSKESGYNMVHFTPIQELGKSGSSFSIKDQLKLDPVYSTKKKTFTLDDVEEIVSSMKEDWEVLSLTDLVLNHTANESPWLNEHPECSYNLVNSAYLKPAYLLDRILWNFTLNVSKGAYEDRGLPAYIDSEHHLNMIRSILSNELIPKHKFWQFAQCDIVSVISQFKNTILSGIRGDDSTRNSIKLIADAQYRRNSCSIDLPLAVHKLYSSLSKSNVENENLIGTACDNLRVRLQELNEVAAHTIMSHVNTGLDNFMANVRWRFLNGNGLKLGRVSPDTPLMWNYFTLPKQTLSEKDEEEMMYSSTGAYCMANNGWVMGDDPMRNFAESGSNVFLRRELIPWGDIVKLRYGSSPKDCPFLWHHMRKYAVEMAQIFHGVRLDNCHSTPIHVAEYMLDEARKERPDLYVIAELFTNSEYADNTFINRLGINSLIREGLNGFNTKELGRLVHRYGGQPVGSFTQPSTRLMTPSLAHALFMDQTHDNESVIEKHTAEDLLPYSAVVSMTCCASGSNRGYDEMVPHYIDVVNETRPYKKWNNSQSSNAKNHVDFNSGIVKVKLDLNNLHVFMAKSGFKEVFVDTLTDDIISITRHNPVSHQSIILYAHTSFSAKHTNGVLNNVSIPGLVEEVILEGRLSKISDATFIKSSELVNGLENYKVELAKNIKPSESKIFSIVNPKDDSVNVLNFHNLQPGSIVVLKVNLPEYISSEVLKIRKLLTAFGYQMKTLSSRKVSLNSCPLDEIFEELSLAEMNTVLYRTDAEERDDGLGFGAYHVPGHGVLPYCGLQSFMTVFEQIRPSNQLGHPMCNNLREGDWMLDYIANRLISHPPTKLLGLWLHNAFSSLKLLPRYLIPLYFEAILHGVHSLAVEICWMKMSRFAGESSRLVRDLCLGSVQMCSYVKSSSLNRLSPSIHPPRPPMILNNSGELVEACPSLCAGLPHFSSGLFRNWGRDTFVALRGLMLLTGRFHESRHIILAYAGCLRHGLIPNLLGEGRSARYNSRDAVWFWLQSIKDYCSTVHKGEAILNDKVLRLYPRDDGPIRNNVEQSVAEVMQEALRKHAVGLRMKERNAGHEIDAEMVMQGFNLEIGVDWKTGFVYGGNQWNCGTWMDKMGSSEKAGNKGVPASPRDGSAVEIVGLSASVVRWLDGLYKSGAYPFEGVKDKEGKLHTWSEWYNQIKQNFEKHFWIGTKLKKDDDDEEEDSNDDNDISRQTLAYINRVNIYKDSVGSSHGYTDYQLRCNFPIAIVVCPDLFREDRAWRALRKVEKHLLGPLGIKTLDPRDLNFIGDYHNNDDSDNFKTAKGFNYHQGPEWVWPVGYFLRAKLMMAQKLQEKYSKGRVTESHAKPTESSKSIAVLSSKFQNVLEDTLTFVEKCLTRHNVHLQNSAWKSIPELTNSDGKHCEDSCEAQAWSVSTLVEVLHDMMLVRSANKS